MRPLYWGLKRCQLRLAFEERTAHERGCESLDEADALAVGQRVLAAQ
jgi:hypothetical protein